MSSIPPSSDPWAGGSPPPFPPPPGPTGGLASWGQRVGAYLIDVVIGSVVIILGFLAKSTPLIAIGYLISIGFWIWNSIQQGNTGQTVGKKMLNIHLQRLDGVTPPGVGLSIGRTFLHIIDGIPCYLGYLWPLWDEKRQTFTDKILNTVVNEGPPPPAQGQSYQGLG